MEIDRAEVLVRIEARRMARQVAREAAAASIEARGPEAVALAALASTGQAAIIEAAARQAAARHRASAGDIEAEAVATAEDRAASHLARQVIGAALAALAGRPVIEGATAEAVALSIARGRGPGYLAGLAREAARTAASRAMRAAGGRRDSAQAAAERAADEAARLTWPALLKRADRYTAGNLAAYLAPDLSAGLAALAGHVVTWPEGQAARIEAARDAAAAIMARRAGDHLAPIVGKGRQVTAVQGEGETTLRQVWPAEIEALRDRRTLALALAFDREAEGLASAVDSQGRPALRPAEAAAWQALSAARPAGLSWADHLAAAVKGERWAIEGRVRRDAAAGLVIAGPEGLASRAGLSSAGEAEALRRAVAVAARRIDREAEALAAGEVAAGLSRVARQAEADALAARRAVALSAWQAEAARVSWRASRAGYLARQGLAVTAYGATWPEAEAEAARAHLARIEAAEAVARRGQPVTFAEVQAAAAEAVHLARLARIEAAGGLAREAEARRERIEAATPVALRAARKAARRRDATAADRARAAEAEARHAASIEAAGRPIAWQVIEAAEAARHLAHLAGLSPAEGLADHLSAVLLPGGGLSKSDRTDAALSAGQVIEGGRVSVALALPVARQAASPEALAHTWRARGGRRPTWQAASILARQAARAGR